MGINFANSQTLTTSGLYVVASDPMRSSNLYYTPHFHVGLNNGNAATNSYIAFDTNYSNSRGLWNTDTFTAPTTGIYWFYFHGSLNDGLYNRYVGIRKNSSSSWELRVYSSSQDDRAFFGGHKLFYLAEGDTCRVYNYNCGLLGANNYTTFSGGLMQ